MKYGQTCQYCGQKFRVSPHKHDDCNAYLRERVRELETGLIQCSDLLSAALKRIRTLEKQDREIGRAA